MDKIKVVQHSKYLDFSGTDRTAQLFYKYLNKSEEFDCYIVYRKGVLDSRREIVESWYGADKVIPYEWEPNPNAGAPYIPKHDNLASILASINPDIFHIHRSGGYEWPGMSYVAPNAKIVETNIFGDTDPTCFIDRHIYISNYIRNRALEKGGIYGPVLYNPIEEPFQSTVEFAHSSRKQLLDRFSLPPYALLMGRVGREDNFDPISLRAFRKISDRFPHVFYLVVNACQNWKDEVDKLNLSSNVIFLDKIIGDKELSEFYAGLDIYAHARHDGECCPCNIQEAMMHGLAVVSHESKIHNGQSEILGSSGFVVPIDDVQAYADVLVDLIADSRVRDQFAWSARRRAMMLFEASCITKNLEKIYKEVLQG